MLEEIKKLTEEGYSSREIEKITGIGRTKVSKVIKENGFAKSLIDPTKEQQEILIGTIIGDGSLFGGGTEKRNRRMNLAHSLKQKNYFLFKYRILKNIVKSEPKERSWIDKRTNKKYSEIRFQSRANPFFTNLYQTWYINKKKIIPLNEIMKAGELTLAVKYFDDGHKNSNGNYEIAMNDYDITSILNFKTWMFEKFGIETTIQSKKTVYVLAKSKSKMQNIIKLIDLDELKYKI